MSVAIHVTAVVAAPTNWLPDDGLQIVLLIPELSLEVAANVAVAYNFPISGDVLILAGHVIAGSMVSITETANVQLVVRLN